jgi:hypothetical protein
VPPNSLVLIEAHITGPDNFTKAAEASNAEKLLDSGCGHGGKVCADSLQFRVSLDVVPQFEPALRH